MPIYEFQCKNPDCNHEFEHLLQSYKNDNPVCEKCGSEVDRKISAGSFDVIGGYQYEYGKKNWKQGKSPSEIANVLSSHNGPNPY